MITNGVITNGTPIRISLAGINGYFLLANTPYAPVDVIEDRIVSFTNISLTLPQTYYNNAQLVVTTDVIKDVYPHIITVD
jgi:hypothetical protein